MFPCASTTAPTGRTIPDARRDSVFPSRLMLYTSPVGLSGMMMLLVVGSSAMPSTPSLQRAVMGVPGGGVTSGDCEVVHEARRRRYKNSMVQMTLVRCVTIEVSFFDRKCIKERDDMTTIEQEGEEFLTSRHPAIQLPRLRWTQILAI